MPEIYNINPASQSSSLAAAIQQSQGARATLDARLAANQADASEDKLAADAEKSATVAIKRSTKLVAKAEVKTEKAKRAQESVLVRKEDADELADQFSKRQGNREYQLNPSRLSLLAIGIGKEIHEATDVNEMIALIRSRMTVDGQVPDVAMIDKAFEFLLDVTSWRFDRAEAVDKARLEKIYRNIEAAKNQFFSIHSVDITVAQKIIGAVDAVSHETGKNINVTLAHYRDIVHQQEIDIQTLRKQYELMPHNEMVRELKGLSTYLGANFKRNNLESAELIKLTRVARIMQAVNGVFRLARQRVQTLENYLELNGVLEVAA